MSQNTAAQPFHDPADFAFLEPLRQAAPEIREEALRVIKGFRAVTWMRRATFSRHHGFCEGYRGRFLLHYAGIEFGHNQSLCPRASMEIPQLPGLVAMGFFLLDAKSHIKPHRGEFNGTLRAHLGLVVPDGCRLRVSDQTRPWREQAWLVFDDFLEHEAWNDSEQTRCVLHVEFFKPNIEQAQREERLAMVQTAVAGMATNHGAAMAAADLRGGSALAAALEPYRDGPAPPLVERFGLFFD